MLDLYPNDKDEGIFLADLTENAQGRLAAWQAAAERGSPYGQYLVGRLAYHGSSLESDGGRAFQYFQLAARQGLPAARFMLAECYRNGIGVPDDQRDLARREAAVWYHLAALQRYLPAEYNLALCYESARHWRRPPTKPWRSNGSTKAARGGHVMSQYRLAQYYARGYDGVEPDHDRAVHWLQEAASHGHEEARKTLEEMMRVPDNPP